MKILICSLTYPLPNGVTSSVNESIDGFLAAGHQVQVLSPDYGTGPVRPQHVTAASSTIGRIIQYFGKDERMFSFGAGPEIQRLVEDFSPDVFWLHTVTWAPSAFERLMLKSRLPKVLTYHTMVDFYGQLYGRQYGGAVGEKQAVKHMIRRSVQVGNAVDRVIIPSHFMAEKLVGFGVTTPITVIPSGIKPIRAGYSKQELAAKFHFRPESPVILYVGRVVKEKSVETLLQMMADLAKLQPTATLLLVGPGEIKEMKAEAKRLGVAKQVIFTDQVSLEEARRCYTGGDVFVFASQSETQGLVLGEAMSAGLPVVALDSPVGPEVYPSGTAVTVKTPQEMAVAVNQLLQNDQKARTLSAAGQSFVEKNFSQETMIKKQIEVFENLLTVGSEGFEPATLSV